LASRKGKGPSSATAAMFKAEAEGRPLSGESSLVHSSGQSLGPGGRKLKTVDSGMDHLFEDDEDGGDGAKRRRNKELGEEGNLDEQVYEEDFADDEEHLEVDDNDEEAKELEVGFFSSFEKKKKNAHLLSLTLTIFQERLKKEYKSANKQRDTGVDESDEEIEAPTTSKQAKAMQKLIRNREDNEAYESDEEKNPYATSVSIFASLWLFALLIIPCRKRRRKKSQLSLRRQDLLFSNNNNNWNLDRRLQSLYRLVQVEQLLPILERRPQHSLLVMAAIQLSPSVQRVLRYQNSRNPTVVEAIAPLEDSPRSQEAEVRALSLKRRMAFPARRRV